MRLRALAPAKVNLSLLLGGARADGRHRLVTAFESLSLADTLELDLEPDAAADLVICPGVDGENLVAHALAALRERGWDAPPVRIRVDKRIPVAAGMAGGSADAAAGLRLAAALDRVMRVDRAGLSLPADTPELERIAAALGADVPSQLEPGVALGTGAGDLVERFGPLREHAFVVLPSPHALPTPAVFREADRLGLARGDAELDALELELGEALRAGAEPPPALLVNDLQPAAISLCPWCETALQRLRDAGAQHAMVSGSGPTVFGVWWGERARERAAAGLAALGALDPPALLCEPVDAAFAAAALT